MNRYVVNFIASGTVHSRYFTAGTKLEAWLQCKRKYRAYKLELINVSVDILGIDGNVTTDSEAMP